MRIISINQSVLVNHSAKLDALIREADVWVDKLLVPYQVFTESYRDGDNWADFKLISCTARDWQDAEKLFPSGLTPCDIWELLSFGRVFPEKQLHFDVGALRSMTCGISNGVITLSLNRMCRRTLIVRPWLSEMYRFGSYSSQRTFYLLARVLSPRKRTIRDVSESGFLC
jgi:hypothetical protein